MRARKAGLFICLCLQSALHGQDFQGAEKLLQRLAEARNEAPKPKTDPASELKRRIELFAREAGKLEVSAAAKGWLELFDAFASLSQEELYASGGYQDRLGLRTLISVLPPSAAWTALAQEVDRRPGKAHEMQKAALQLLMSSLLSDETARNKALAAMKQAASQLATTGEQQRAYFEESLQELAEALEMDAGDAAADVAIFERRLSAMEKDKKHESRHFNYLPIPQLAGITTDEKAEALILRLLRLNIEFSVDYLPSRRLFAKVALRHPELMQESLWSLVEKEEDVPLYELLAKKFPKGGENWRRDQADGIYLLHLIVGGRMQEARRFTMEAVTRFKDNRFSLSISDIAQMRRQVTGSQMLEFLREMLGADPSLPFWEVFIELAAQENASAEALAFLRTQMERLHALGVTHTMVEQHFYQALLAANETDEGVDVMRALVKAGPAEARHGRNDAEKNAAKAGFEKLGIEMTPELDRYLDAGSRNTAADNLERHFMLCLQLARVGRLLGKPEVTTEALTAAMAAFVAISAPPAGRSSRLDGIVQELLHSDRGADAEKVAAEYLISIATPEPERRSGGDDRAQALKALAFIYGETGRHADVLKLLDEATLWGAADLNDLENMHVGDASLTLIAAKALMHEGKKAAARPVIQRLVQNDPGNDAAYQLLLELGGADVEARLDQLQAANRFEERPLIWKARLQLDAGRVAEAEKTIRAAIAIDPSDGEQGKGDRMRAYAVLAGVLEKKGDAEQAKIMRGAVQAIRVSETADDWWSAGLLSRAVKMYEEALNHFADAYCIQSRLALRYSEQGDFVKAAQHYQRAFELMPESFGRVESHCFGCEHAFSGERAQNIADKVFTQLAQKMPDRAQVFYLLGYLREEQDRPAEALAEYRRAVKLDPQYLNAWKKMAELAEAVNLPRNERDDIHLALFHLNPMHESLDEVNDLRRLWDAVLAVEASLPKIETGPIYPLASSKGGENSRGGYSSTHEAHRANLQDNNHLELVLNVIEGMMRAE